MERTEIRPRANGFGLLEVILVFALVIAAGALVLSMFGSAQPSSEASRATTNLTVLAGDVKSLYAVGHDYSTISTQNLIDSRLVPADMVNAAGTGLQGEWADQPVSLRPETAAPSLRFVIVYEGVPPEACLKFIQGAAPYFEKVDVGTSPTGPGTTVYTTGTPLAQNTLVGVCNSSTPLVAFFTSH